MSATSRSRGSYQDAYQTPEWCVHSLLPFIKFKEGDVVLEPCRGEGNIYRALPKGIKRRWCEIDEGRDYLKRRHSADVIITNPPFSQATTFLRKSLAEAPTVIYLLRLNFLEGQCRHEFWQQHKPSHLFVLSRRPSFTGKGTDATGYGWFVWDRDRAGRINAEHWLTVL